MILGVSPYSRHSVRIYNTHLFIFSNLTIRFFGTEPLMEKVTAERPQFQPGIRSAADELRAIRKDIRARASGSLDQADTESRVLLRAQHSHVAECSLMTIDAADCATRDPVEDDIARLAGFVQSPVINTSEDKGANSYSVYAASACRQMHSAPTPNLR